MVWPIQLNEELRRSEVHHLLGGQRFGGIATPSNSNDILIFTDPKSGAEYGYDRHEGMGEDGSYRYTGAGQVGDMSFTGVNKTIIESPETGKVIRLFLANSPMATYKGSFTLSDERFTYETAPDRNGQMRTVIVFNLTPLEADVSELPEFGAKESRSIERSPWKEPNLETYLAQQKSRGISVSEISRSEHQLQAQFGNWLLAQGHRLLHLPLATGNTTIFPDLFDETSMTVFEAKRSSGRQYVRTAIGQVLDYQNVALANGLDVRCAILLAGEPVKDLVSLCSTLGIELFVRDSMEENGAPFKKVTVVA